jgi:ribosomal protein S19
MCSIANRRKWVRFPSQPEKKEEEKRKKMERKNRGDRVKVEERNQVCGVHNGKSYVKRQVTNPRYVGLKWGERAKTRKPCTKGADKQAKARRARAQKAKGKSSTKK